MCKMTNRVFKLHFTHPFLLTDYLQPNDYDWRVDGNDLSFDHSQTALLVLDTQTSTPKEHRQQRHYLQSMLEKHPLQQIHCYTNASFCYEDGFARDFATLFKPTDQLELHLADIARAIGQQYITVSARFCNLIGDFNEEVYSEPLPPVERQQLLDNCLSQLKQLRELHPDHRLVVCSDSTTFLQKAQEQHGAYVVPGHVSHIGNDVPHNYPYYEKTFLDFFIIARASHAYLLLGPSMHQSGFPYAAALSNNRPYDIIKI